MTARAAGPGAAPDEFAALLGEHRGILWKIANSYCRAGEDRDDLVQEICLQLWRAYPAYDPERRFSTWMYRVALNTAISAWRTRQSRQRREVPLDDARAGDIAGALPAEGSAAEDPRRLRLYGALRELGDLDRALVLLHFEDRSHREISEVLGISETNVGTKLNRLKQTMRRRLAAEGES